MTINIIIIGADLSNSFDAGSLRVRNLFDTILENTNYFVTNIVKFGDLSSISKNMNFEKIPKYFRIFKIFQIFIRIKKDKNKIVLYNYGSFNITNLDLILIAKLLHIPIVFDIVENIHIETDYPRRISILKAFINRNFEKVLHWYASGCIAISGNLFKMISSFSKQRYSVIHLPISVLMREWESPMSKVNKKLIIFYGGSFGPKDGLEFLIKAFDSISSEFPTAELHLSGKGAIRHIKMTEEFINGISSKERVKMLGTLERQDYVNKVISSDIVCVTRTNSIFANYGFPFKLGEYLAAGKAIIVSDISDVSKYLVNEVDAIIIDPESVDSIASSLRKLLQNEAIRLEIGLNAQRKALKYFDSKKVGKDFEDFLNVLLRK